MDHFEHFAMCIIERGFQYSLLRVLYGCCPVAEQSFPENSRPHHTSWFCWVRATSLHGVPPGFEKTQFKKETFCKLWKYLPKICINLNTSYFSQYTKQIYHVYKTTAVNVWHGLKGKVVPKWKGHLREKHASSCQHTSFTCTHKHIYSYPCICKYIHELSSSLAISIEWQVNIFLYLTFLEQLMRVARQTTSK